MDPDTQNNSKAPNNFSRTRKEKFLSIKYQLDWIRSLKDQIDWANNPEVLPDYVLFLGIRRRSE